MTPTPRPQHQAHSELPVRPAAYGHVVVGNSAANASGTPRASAARANVTMHISGQVSGTYCSQISHHVIGLTIYVEGTDILSFGPDEGTACGMFVNLNCEGLWWAPNSGDGLWMHPGTDWLNIRIASFMCFPCDKHPCPCPTSQCP